MLRISKGKETFTLKGDHLETNFHGFYQKSPHWRPQFTSLQYLLGHLTFMVPFIGGLTSHHNVQLGQNLKMGV